MQTAMFFQKTQSSGVWESYPGIGAWFLMPNADVQAQPSHYSILEWERGNTYDRNCLNIKASWNGIPHEIRSSLGVVPELISGWKSVGWRTPTGYPRAYWYRQIRRYSGQNSYRIEDWYRTAAGLYEHINEWMEYKIIPGVPGKYSSEFRIIETYCRSDGSVLINQDYKPAAATVLKQEVSSALWPTEAYTWDRVRTIERRHSIPSGLVYTCYEDALSEVTLDTNNIANLLSIVDLIREIASGPEKWVDAAKDLAKLAKDGAKAASDAWLKYRYLYNTTKSDIEEISSKISSLSDIDLKNFDRTCRARQTCDEGVFELIVRVTQVRDLTPWEHMKRLGVAPDLYNGWDLVPYSFIVDWFLPIGDMLESVSKSWLLDSGVFRISRNLHIWKWSDEVSDEDSGLSLSVSYFKRWKGEPPEWSYYTSDPSNKTVVQRCIDAGALLINQPSRAR